MGVSNHITIINFVSVPQKSFQVCILTTWVTTFSTLKRSAQSSSLRFILNFVGTKKLLTHCAMTKQHNPTFRSSRENWMWNFASFILLLTFTNNQLRHIMSGGLGVEEKFDMWEVTSFSLMLKFLAYFLLYFTPTHLLHNSYWSLSFQLFQW